MKELERAHKNDYIIVTPKLEAMWFRETLVGDEETMAYNKKWGGAIDFPKNKWEDWYARWVAHP